MINKSFFLIENLIFSILIVTIASYKLTNYDYMFIFLIQINHNIIQGILLLLHIIQSSSGKKN